MKPWFIVAIDGELKAFAHWSRATGSNGVVYNPRKQAEVEFQGGFTDNQSYWGFDDELTCDKAMDWLVDNYPTRTYIKTKSIIAAYREVGPQKRAQFSEKGLMPV